MPNATVHTDGSNNPITLSVTEERGHHIQTIITINGIQLPRIENNFNDRPIGTNVSLANATVSVVTTSAKVTPAQNSIVVFTLKGAQEPHVNNNEGQFDGNPIMSHKMRYDLL
jgi:hypothetical protein